jgi:hypothetical protein
VPFAANCRHIDSRPSEALSCGQILDEASRPDVVALFLQAEHAAEARACHARRVVLAHAGAHVLARHHRDVERHLEIHVSLASVPPDERKESAQDTRRTK